MASPTRKARRTPVAAKLMRSALRKTPDYIQYVTPVRPRSAGPLHAKVYEQVEREFGLLAPPLTLHSPAPGPMTASWLMLRESLVADGQVSRADKEAVAAAVSLSNACPFCVEVHSAVVHGLNDPAGAAALTGDRLQAISDPRRRALATWAYSTRERNSSVERPFSVEQAPELIGVATTFHYLNRMVTIFLLDTPWPAAMPLGARAQGNRMLGWYMGNLASQPHPPGDSLPLLPAAEVPTDLGWAFTAPTIRAAFARSSQAIQTAGEQYLSARVREMVRHQLVGWDGSDPGLNMRWLANALTELPPAEQPAGRLALLTAIAAYRVDATIIDQFRAVEPSDEALVSVTSWAAMAAARHVASWQLPF